MDMKPADTEGLLYTNMHILTHSTVSACFRGKKCNSLIKMGFNSKHEYVLVKRPRSPYKIPLFFPLSLPHSTQNHDILGVVNKV